MTTRAVHSATVTFRANSEVVARCTAKAAGQDRTLSAVMRGMLRAYAEGKWDAAVISAQQIDDALAAERDRAGKALDRARAEICGPGA